MSRKLQYYDFNGYAEAIRYLLHYGKLEFEDVRYKGEDWPIKSIKDNLPYGQLPFYEEYGKSLNQSLAIARYVASQVGLLPSDPWEQAQLDAAVQNYYDLIGKIKPFISEKDPEKKEENKPKVDETVEYFFSRFEKELKAGNGYVNGKLSWADFVLVATVELLNLTLGGPFEKNYPTIEALISKIHSLPGVKEYLANKKPYTR